MKIIPIISIPNQSLSTPQISGAVFDIAIRTVDGELLVDVSINRSPVILGVRAQANQKILPYRYMETFGNLMLVGDSDLTYENLGTAILLYHLDPGEI